MSDESILYVSLKTRGGTMQREKTMDIDMNTFKVFNKFITAR